MVGPNGVAADHEGRMRETVAVDDHSLAVEIAGDEAGDAVVGIDVGLHGHLMVEAGGRCT
jgi:hypothetical protein